MEESFDEFWSKILDYSEQTGLPTWYLEEEFIIDGEFLPMPIRTTN